MEMKKAVALAKGYILDLYTEEHIDEVGLEEIEFNEANDAWNITIGFRRPWGREAPRKPLAAGIFPYEYRERWYKAVQIANSDGRLISVKDRILKDAA